VNPLNPLIRAADSSVASKQTNFIIGVINLVCTIIFIVDVAIRIILMGPCLFFDSSFNILDFVLVTFNVIGFIGGAGSFVSNFRILRLLRLTRLLKVANIMSAGKEKVADRTNTLDLIKFTSLVTELAGPLMNFTVLLLIVIFMMSVLSMILLGGTPPNYEYWDDKFPGLRPMSISWTGESIVRMNFGTFNNAFVTLFNMYCLDGWYPTMWGHIKSYGFVASWYFFIWIVMSNWFLQGLLTAFVILEMEKQAREYIITEAKSNYLMVQRVLSIKQRQTMKRSFMLFKKNTIESEDARVKAMLTGKASSIKVRHSL
jgi:hypothetical protein